MGNIKWFSADSRDKRPPSPPPPLPRLLKEGKEPLKAPIKNNPNPDPSKFKIIERLSVEGYPLLWVNYPNCTNYEGNKILLYDKGCDVQKLIDEKRLDPHFFKDGDSPIARFEPTPRGWQFAIHLINALCY